MYIKQAQNGKMMTYLLEFKKVRPTSAYESVSYKSFAKIGNEVFDILISKNPWKLNKYYVHFLHNGKQCAIYANYSSAKKAMIDCQTSVNHLIQKTI